MKMMRLKKGFTLLELMIAVAILVISIVALLASFINSFLLNEANNNMAIAANDAQYVLERIKAETDYENITDCTFTDFSNLQDESIEVTVIEGDNIKEVTVDVSWTERERQRNLDVTTYFSW